MSASPDILTDVGHQRPQDSLVILRNGGFLVHHRGGSISDAPPLFELSERLAQLLHHRIGRHPHRLGGEVGVARRGLDLRVAQKLADHRQALTRRDSRRRKGVTQVVDTHVLEAGAGTDALPERLKVTDRLARQGADDDPRVAVDALGVAQQFDGGLAERMVDKPP